MNRRQFLKTAVAGSALGAGLTYPPSAKAETKYHWKMVSAFPKNLPGTGRLPYLLAQNIETMTNQRIKIQVFGAGEMTESFDTLEAVSTGKAQLGTGTPYYWVNKHPAFNICSNMPFGLNAQELIAWLRFGGGMELLDELYEQFNLKPFPIGNSGVQMGGWFNKEINSINDFNELKIRIPALGGEVLKQLNAKVISLPANRILPALQSGEIDAAEWIAPYDDLQLGLYKAAKFYYWPAWHEPSALQDLFINLKTYQELPPDLKAIIEQASFALYNYLWSEFTFNNGTALIELVKKHNVQLKKFPDQVLMDLAKLSRDVVEKIAGQNPLSLKIYNSYNAFKSSAIGWTQIGEEAFSLARSLTYPFL